MTSNELTLLRIPGALTTDGQGPWAAVKSTYAPEEKRVRITTPDGNVQKFSVTDITQDISTDRIVFVSKGKRYTLREFREEDGQWLSKFKVDLPLEVVELLGEDEMVEESIDAYASEDSPYILGVVYTTQNGRYVRQSGEWLLLSPQDNTFNDMIATTIDPDKADAFLDLYDKNYVSVTDAEKYESADSEDAEPSNENNSDEE